MNVKCYCILCLSLALLAGCHANSRPSHKAVNVHWVGYNPNDIDTAELTDFYVNGHSVGIGEQGGLQALIIAAYGLGQNREVIFQIDEHEFLQQGPNPVNVFTALGLQGISFELRDANANWFDKYLDTPGQDF